MLTDLARRVSAGMLEPLARGLSGMGLTPNTLTVIGFVLNVGVAALLAQGPAWFGWGALALLAASAFDAFDGSVARVTGQVTRFGGFLDSTLDRFSEAVVYLGLVYAYLVQTTPPRTVEILLIILAIIGSLMVSYTRARVEGLGGTMKEGFLTRLERIVVLTLGLAFSPLFAPSMLVTLAVLAIGTNFTAVQRILVARERLG